METLLQKSCRSNPATLGERSPSHLFSDKLRKMFQKCVVTLWMTTSLLDSEPFHPDSLYHKDTSLLICRAMIGTSLIKELSMQNQNHKKTKTKIKKYKQRTKKYNQCLLLPSQQHNNIKDMKTNRNKAIFCGSEYLHVQQ